MKRISIITALAICLLSCSDKESINKPKNLIDQNKMVDILYDLNLFQSIKNNNYNIIVSNKINPEKFIYEKYQIDSLQFVESHKYYLSNIDMYESMVNQMIDRLNKKIESLPKSNTIQMNLQPADSLKPRAVLKNN